MIFLFTPSFMYAIHLFFVTEGSYLCHLAWSKDFENYQNLLHMQDATDYPNFSRVGFCSCDLFGSR